MYVLYANLLLIVLIDAIIPVDAVGVFSSFTIHCAFTSVFVLLFLLVASVNIISQGPWEFLVSH